MTVEMTLSEAEILIACLTYAEGIALIDNPAINEALRALRPWRSALLQTYLHARTGGVVDVRDVLLPAEE